MTTVIVIITDKAVPGTAATPITGLPSVETGLFAGTFGNRLSADGFRITAVITITILITDITGKSVSDQRQRNPPESPALYMAGLFYYFPKESVYRYLSLNICCSIRYDVQCPEG